MSEKPLMSLALVDDHILFRKGLITLISKHCNNSKILFEADNGQDLQKKINKNNAPDIILLDIQMPEMNGIETVKWLNLHFPLTKILVITMFESEESIIQMLKLGVKGYLCKNVEPQKLADALYTIYNDCFYYTNFITQKLIRSLQAESNCFIEKNKPIDLKKLNDKEKKLLKLACSELTYGEIAKQMSLSLKSVEGYQKSLFRKLHVKNRVGLVLFAIRRKLVKVKN